MKTKFSILAFLIVSATLAIMVSCQKNDATPTNPVTNLNSNMAVNNSSSTQQSTRKTHQDIDDICSTWDPILRECFGDPTNCLCEVDLHGGKWWATLGIAISNGSTGVSSFFADSTNVANTFPVLWNKNHSGNQDSILKSGNYYISVQQHAGTTATEFFLLVKHNSTNALAFVMTCDTL